MFLKNLIFINFWDICKSMLGVGIKTIKAAVDIAFFTIECNLFLWMGLKNCEGPSILGLGLSKIWETQMHAWMDFKRFQISLHLGCRIDRNRCLSAPGLWIFWWRSFCTWDAGTTNRAMGSISRLVLALSLNSFLYFNLIHLSNN